VTTGSHRARILPAVCFVEVKPCHDRVVLPPHLRTLARVDGEVELELKTPVSQRSVLDSLEAKYPMLRGTIRDHVTKLRRQWLDFLFVARTYRMNHRMLRCRTQLLKGTEPFLIIGAIAGG